MEIEHSIFRLKACFENDLKKKISDVLINLVKHQLGNDDIERLRERLDDDDSFDIHYGMSPWIKLLRDFESMHMQHPELKEGTKILTDIVCMFTYIHT